MELHRFFRYAIEKMCKEKKSLNHFIKLAEALRYKGFVFSVKWYKNSSKENSD